MCSGLTTFVGLGLTSAGAANTPISSFVDSPNAIAFDGTNLWVVSSATNSVSELSASGDFIQSVAVGVAPVAVAADGTHVWVANSGPADQGGSITELNSNGTFAATIDVSPWGQPTAISSDGTDVWVTMDDDIVVEIAASSGSLTNLFGYGNDPTGISSDGANVWIADSQDGDVGDFDIATSSFVNSTSVGNDPTGVFSDGQYVWVTNSGDGTVSVLNAADGSYAFNTGSSPIPVGNDPTGIVSNGTNAWVTNSGDGTVTELSIGVSTISVVGTYSVGNGPAALALAGSDVWVDNAGDGTLSELNVSGAVIETFDVADDSGLQSQTIPAGSWPTGVATDDASVWETNNSDDTVSEVNEATSALEQTVAVGYDPTSVSSDGTHVWVVNQGDGTITALNASDGSYALGTGTAPIADPDGPESISSDGTHVWITNSDGTITVLNASDGSFAFGTGTAPIADPDGAAHVSSDGTHVWIANNDGTITVLNASDGSYAFGTDSSPIADNDDALYISSDGTHVWIANNDGTVTALNTSDGSYAFGTGSSAIALDEASCLSAIASNGSDVWVTSQCPTNAFELSASTGELVRDVNLEYAPVAMAVDAGGDVWIANAYVGNGWSIAQGGGGSYDGANDPNDQGTLTELSAPAPLVTSSTTSVATDTYNYSPDVQVFTVPAGVTQLTLNALGGEGGRGGRDAAGRPPLGGYQGEVSGTIDVTPGEVLSIAVGHGGHDSSLAEDCVGGVNSLFDPNDAIGGSNPLGAYSGGNGGAAGQNGCSGYGGSGGAASVVEIGSSLSHPTSVATVVAGGSGGAGGSGQYPRTLGQISLASFATRSDGSTTDGQAGISVFNACVGAASCDGGGGAGGGGGAQGGTQGLVEFGSGESNEWFGLGASPGENSTGSLGGLSAQYPFYSGDGANGSVTISYATGLPGAPTNVTPVVGASSVTLSWNAPSVIGSSAISDYVVRYSRNGGVTWTTVDTNSTSTSTTLNLSNGGSDIFEVAAVNRSGQGDWSALANPPDAPTLTGITAGNSYISTSFSAGGNGGSAITGYQYSLDGGTTWLAATGVASPLVISSLTNGTSYTVEVRAVNAAGSGPASNTETATPFAAPDTPDATMFVTTSQDGQIGVAWTAPNNNGSAISEYTVTLYDASFAGNQVTNCDVSDLTCYDGSSSSVSSTYAISGCTLSNLSCTITGLTDYVTYWVSIQATNAAGSSGRSSPRVPAIPSLVTVAYNANGGTGSISDSTYEIGQPSGVTLPTSGVTNYGYVLAGWSTTPGDATTEVSTPYVPPAPVAPSTTSYVTLYALWTPAPQYTLSYDGNGDTAGSPPTDPSSPYYSGTSATVLANTGNLVDTGYTFGGWNTAANGSGTSYSAGATLTVSADTVLYAQWSAAPQYTLTYDGNGDTGGSAPTDPSSPYYSGTSATVLANTGNLVDTGYTFGGWNTAANGSGTSYSAGATLTMSADTVLYAAWTPMHSSPSSPPSSPPAPLSAAPGPPQTPSGSIANGSGDINWQPPASNGGGAITDYTVTNAKGDVVCTTTGLGCKVSGLSGTGPFTFSITATNAYGTSAKVTVTIHLTPAACGTTGAPKCALKMITIGVVFFGEGQFSIGAHSHATLVAAARKIREDHITRVSIVATSDSVYLSSYNRTLSLHRAKATESGLEAILRRVHYRVERFVLSARGVSKKYRGLAANRRATITGLIASR